MASTIQGYGNFVPMNQTMNQHRIWSIFGKNSIIVKEKIRSMKVPKTRSTKGKTEIKRSPFFWSE